MSGYKYRYDTYQDMAERQAEYEAPQSFENEEPDWEQIDADYKRRRDEERLCSSD